MGAAQGDAEEPIKTYQVVLRSDAGEDISEAFQYYEDKAEGLGSEFLSAVEACIASLDQFPTRNALLYKQVRRALLRRFPYGVFYVVEGDTVTVIACVHSSRSPRRWKQRV
jgi:plasmid stabilization system protein ParE